MVLTAEDDMATGNTLSSTQGRHLLNPNTLNVQGRALSPRPNNGSGINNNDEDPNNMSSTRTSSIYDDDDRRSDGSEEYTVLDGVREMNHILVKQIETLRLKIQVDEKNYNVSKERMAEESGSKIKNKESEIEDLRESITDRDERIQSLEKASREKDRHIKNKCEEIESLKELVQQTEEYAKKLQQQVGRVKTQTGSLEEDPLYKHQNEEIGKLTKELELLRSRLATMEQELQRAMNVIEQQNDKMKTITEERGRMQQRFKDDLEKASKAMRQEVERMREVMRQNYEEMKHLREQNRQMSDDVRDIKNMLKTKVSMSQNDRYHNHHDDEDEEDDDDDQHQMTMDGHTNHTTYSNQRYGQKKAANPRGSSGLVGGNIRHTSSFRNANNPHHAQQNSRQQQHDPYSQQQLKRQPTMLRESTTTIIKTTQPSRSPTRNAGGGQYRTSVNDNSPLTSQAVYPPSPLESSRSRLSPDRISRPINDQKADSSASKMGVGFGRTFSRQNTSHPNIPQSNNAREDPKNFPPICSFKEASGLLPNRQPSARGGKLGVRKGSAIKK